MIYLDRIIRLLRYDYSLPTTCYAIPRILYDPKTFCDCIKVCKYLTTPPVKLKEVKPRSYKYEL